MKSSMLFDTVDLVVPVTSHKKRMKKRGYNQVLSFAQAIANVLEVPCNNLVLIKTKTLNLKFFKQRNNTGTQLQTALKLTQMNSFIKNIF